MAIKLKCKIKAKHKFKNKKRVTTSHTERYRRSVG